MKRYLYILSLVLTSLLLPDRLFALSAADVSQLDYALYASDASAMAGRQMVLTLSMRNANYISAYQTDLVLPEGFSIAYIRDESGELMPQVTILRTLTTRHTLSVSQQPDGSYRLLSTSVGNRNYGGSDGPVAYITVNVSADVADGEYPLILRNQEMAEVTNISHKVESVESVISVFNSQDALDTPETDVEITDVSDVVNTLYLTPLKVFRGRQAKIDINMRNTEALTGFQMDLLLPSGFTLAKDAQGNPLLEIGGRTTASRHAFNVAQQTDGSYRLIAISTSNQTFSGSDGTVVTLVFDVSDEMPQGEYRAILRKQELAKPDNTNFHPENVISKVKVELPAYTFDLKHFEPYLLYTNNVGLTPGSRVTLPVGMINLKAISGFQADLILPEGVTVATQKDAFGSEEPMITLADRTSGTNHTVNCVRQEDGTYRILCASTSNHKLSGHLGTVFYITLDVAPTVKKKNYSVYFVEQEFGEADNTRHLASVPFVSRLYVRNVLPTMGDLTQDGVIDALDIKALIEILLHKDIHEYEEEAGDSNQDGHFSIVDIMQLIKSL